MNKKSINRLSLGEKEQLNESKPGVNGWFVVIFTMLGTAVMLLIILIVAGLYQQGPFSGIFNF